MRLELRAARARGVTALLCTVGCGGRASSSPGLEAGVHESGAATGSASGAGTMVATPTSGTAAAGSQSLASGAATSGASQSGSSGDSSVTESGMEGGAFEAGDGGGSTDVDAGSGATLDATLSTDGAPPPACGHRGEACCTGQGCNGPLACRGAFCETVPQNGTGQACTGDGTCATGACETVGDASVCSTTCGTSRDCIPGWTCTPEPRFNGEPICACTPTQEVCDGKDNDCDGVVDNEPAVDAWCSARKAGDVCENGTCGCAVTCGSTCIDTSSDPDNCGGCGVSCAGSCSLGRCVVVLAGTTEPFSIAVDSTSVYFSANVGGGSLVAVPIGGGPTRTLVGGQPQIEGIAVDPTSAYYTNLGTLYEIPLDGGDPIGLSPGHARVILVTGSHVYWVDDEQAQGTVNSVPFDGGAPAWIATGLQDPSGLALNAFGVFWTQYNGGTVQMAPLDGGATVTVASEQALPFEVVADSNHVYWVEYGAGAIWSAPMDGGAPLRLEADQGSLQGLAIDGTNLYWTTAGGAVMKASLDGGVPVMLAFGQTAPGPIAVDTTSVYWGNSAPLGSALMKVTPK